MKRFTIAIAFAVLGTVVVMGVGLEASENTNSGNPEIKLSDLYKVAPVEFDRDAFVFHLAVINGDIIVMVNKINHVEKTGIASAVSIPVVNGSSGGLPYDHNFKNRVGANVNGSPSYYYSYCLYT